MVAKHRNAKYVEGMFVKKIKTVIHMEENVKPIENKILKKSYKKRKERLKKQRKRQKMKKEEKKRKTRK